MTRSCANHMIITRLTRATGCHAQPFRFTEHGLHTKGVQKITATIHEIRTSNKPTDQLSHRLRLGRYVRRYLCAMYLSASCCGSVYLGRCNKCSTFTFTFFKWPLCAVLHINTWVSELATKTWMTEARLVLVVLSFFYLTVYIECKCWTDKDQGWAAWCWHRYRSDNSHDRMWTATFYQLRSMCFCCIISAGLHPGPED